MQPTVIGREAELAAIDRLLTRATTGLSALILQGEPGIGKTTLWEAARSEASERGYRVLSARPARAESSLPLGAFGDLFSNVESTLVEGLPVPQRNAFKVALLLAEPSDLQSAQRALAVATVSLLRALTEGAEPVLLAVDDVQWLDKSSAAALSYALRRVQDRPIAIALSLRGGGMPPSPLGLDVSAGADRMERRALGPLSLAALHRLLTVRVATSFPRTALVKIEAASGGNPFYALEIARALIRSGGQVRPGEPLPIPEALGALTADRVAALPARTREALLVAAVAFESSMDEMARAAGTDIAKALDPAVREGVIGLEGGTVRFTHPLLASAVLSRAAPARIREIHAAFALTVRSDEARARHLGLAADGPDEVAARALDVAGARARLRGAPIAAAEMLERARDLTPPNAPDEALNRTYQAARYYAEAGDVHQAGALLEQMLQTVPQGTARARALQLSGQVRAWSASFPEALEFALDALQEAPNDIALKAEIELDVVFCCISMGDLASAGAHARAAVAFGEAAGPEGIQAESLAILSIIEFLEGQGISEARMARALALEDPLRAGPVQMRPRVVHALLLLFTGRLDEAVPTLIDLVAEAGERGQETAVLVMSFYLVWAYVWRGDIGEAVRVADEARDVALLNDDPSMRALALSAGALAAAHAGEVDRARATAEEALALFRSIHWTLGTIWPLWALGFLELSVGNPARVNQLLRPLADTIAPMGFVDPILAIFLPDEIEALVALGDFASAVRFAEWLEQGGRQLNRAWAAAAAARSRALIAAADGDLQSALDALDLALVEHQRANMPLEVARTLLVKGQVHRRRKEKRLADTALRESLRISEKIGASLWTARARTELARIGLRPRAPSDLTATERRIAELAAAGMTNRQVAKAAFVSPKTVDNVLGRVYRKLGIASRAQLGAILAKESGAAAATNP